MMGIRRSLVLCTAVLTVGACQDNIIVPAPPAPPPPPPTNVVDATVSILGLDMIPGPGSVNPTAVAGDINVSLNIEEGDNTVTAVDLLFDGTPVGCATINTNTVPGQGVSLSTTGGADVVECFWNTDTFAGVCDGNNLPPQFDNGTHTLGAQITLDDGTTRTASNTQQVTLVNTDLLTLVMLPGAQSLVSGGVTYYGGPTDTDGDGTDDNSVEYAVCPVSFNGTTVASLSLAASSGTGPDADLGSGSGTADLDSAAPFVWTVDPTDNDRLSGNPVEDDVNGVGLAGGHDFATTGQILDDAGLDVTPQFAGATANDIFLDFTAPLPGAGSELTVDGASVAVSAAGTYFSPASAFDGSGVTDNGVGFTFGSGSGSQVDIGDCTVAANFDDDPATPFVPLFSDVASPADADEDDWSVGDDGGPTPRGADSGIDCYVAEIVDLRDDLGNLTDLLAIGAPDGAINTGAGGTAVSWGADGTPPAVVVLEPDTDPADSPVLILNPDPDNNGGIDPDDFSLGFELADPVLASGDPGSDVALVGCDPCLSPSATDQDATDWPVNQLSGRVFEVDIAGQADGPYTVTLDFEDRAVPSNAAVDDFTYVLDNSAPAISALDPAPVGSVGTAAGSIIMSIGETVTDANLIAVMNLTLTANGTDALGAGASASCSVANAASNLYTLDASTGEVDRNLIDLSNGTSLVDFSGSTGTPETFAITDPFGPGVGGTVEYCFVIDAEDNAFDKFGAAAPNVSQLVTSVSVTWLP